MIELTSRLQELYVGLPFSSADMPSSLTQSTPYFLQSLLCRFSPYVVFILHGSSSPLSNDKSFHIDKMVRRNDVLDKD